jgi:hypothetical protein
MTRRLVRVTAALVVAGTLGLLPACSTTGSRNLTCTSAHVAPSSQPGASSARAALDWYLKNGSSSFPRTGFERSGASKTRVVYSDGSHQVSVSALPADPGKPRTWVVLMTYSCS